MRKLILSLFLIFSLVGSVGAQAPIRSIESPQYSQTFTVTNTTATSGIDVRQLNINYWRSCFTITSGTPTFTLVLQKSNDNSSFSTLVSSGSVSASDCTAITEGNTNYIKVNPSAYSGASSSVLVTISGWITNPDIGSIAGGSTTTPAYTRIQDGTGTALATVDTPSSNIAITKNAVITGAIQMGYNIPSNDFRTITNTSSSGSALSISSGTVGATVPHMLNTGGTTVSPLASIQSGGDAASGGTLLGVASEAYNGSTYDRLRTANGASNTTGTGLLGTGNLLWDGTNFQKQSSATSEGLGSSFGDARNPGQSSVLAGTGITYSYNGSTWDRQRSADLGTLVTSTSTTSGTGQVSIGVRLQEKGSRWGVSHSPAAGSQATISVAAESGVRHVVDCIEFSGGATTAPALTQLSVFVIDGATGVNNRIWTYLIIVPASTGQTILPHSVCGLNLVGTTNTAMTIEFSAGLANLFQNVSMTGFNIN